MIAHRPEGIDFTLLKVRTDLERTPPHLAPLIRVDRKHMADILKYVAYLEDELLNAQQEMDEMKNEIG